MIREVSFAWDMAAGRCGPVGRIADPGEAGRAIIVCVGNAASGAVIGSGNEGAALSAR